MSYFRWTSRKSTGIARIDIRVFFSGRWVLWWMLLGGYEKEGRGWVFVVDVTRRVLKKARAGVTQRISAWHVARDVPEISLLYSLL